MAPPESSREGECELGQTQRCVGSPSRCAVRPVLIARPWTLCLHPHFCRLGLVCSLQGSRYRSVQGILNCKAEAPGGGEAWGEG